MDEKGYFKFKCNWIKTKLNLNIKQLNQWRAKLYRLGLIGVNSDGIGFGNISQRIKEQEFIITGAGTGSFPVLNKNHFSIVKKCDVKHNTVVCRGPIIASSESMSHAVIYKFLPDINTVIHVHNHPGWKKLSNKIPTTSESAQYGTPELAKEIERLLEETNLKEVQVFVTAGHPDGIFSFGKNIKEAADVLMKSFNRF